MKNITAEKVDITFFPVQGGGGGGVTVVRGRF